ARLIAAVAAVPHHPARAEQGQSAGTGWLEAIGGLLFPASPRLAAAFGLAAMLAAGGAAGGVAGRGEGSGSASPALVALNHGERVASGSLLAALEAAPSKALTGDLPKSDVVPVQSFRSRDGAFCREYRAGDQNGQAFSGVACRQAGGAWRIAAHVETPT